MTLPVRKITNRINAVIEGVDITAEPSGEAINSGTSHYSRILEAAA